MISSTAITKLAERIEVDPAVLNELLTDVRSHFSRRTIHRKGKERPIAVPGPALKRVHRQIVRHVLRSIPTHESSFCRTGRSIIGNARRHLGSRYVYTFDIADAFPKTRYNVVKGALRRALAANGMTSGWAAPITQLCTLDGSLPQGAPTSSSLLDVVLMPVDNALTEAATRHGARYSRYADDLTLSGGCGMPWAEPEIVGALSQVGLRLRHSKTRKWEPPKRATVTGIVLRERLMLPDEALSRVKGLVTELKSRPSGLRETDVKRIRGTLAYVGQFHPRIADRLAAECGVTLTRRRRSW